MPEFKVDVTICVSAYVDAKNEDEARELFLEEFGAHNEANPPCHETYIGASNKAYVDFGGPIRLSPVATSYGFDPASIENTDE